MRKDKTFTIAALLAASAAFSDTLVLKDGTALDGDVSRPNENCYVLTVGSSEVTFAAEDVASVAKNDKKGDYDFNKINPLAAKHQQEMQSLTGLSEEQKEKVQLMLVPLGSDDPVVRAEAVQALLSKGKEVNIAKFLQASASASTPPVAAEILNVLVALDPAVAKEALQERARDIQPEVRARALELMGKTKDAESSKIIAAGLKDHDTAVQIAAATGLANAGDKRATSVLIEQLDSVHPQVRNACTNALKRIWADDATTKEMVSPEEWKRYWGSQMRKVAEPIDGDELTPLVEEPEGGVIIRG